MVEKYDAQMKTRSRPWILLVTLILFTCTLCDSILFSSRSFSAHCRLVSFRHGSHVTMNVWPYFVPDTFDLSKLDSLQIWQERITGCRSVTPTNRTQTITWQHIPGSSWFSLFCSLLDFKSIYTKRNECAWTNTRAGDVLLAEYTQIIFTSFNIIWSLAGVVVADSRDGSIIITPTTPLGRPTILQYQSLSVASHLSDLTSISPDGGTFSKCTPELAR